MWERDELNTNNGVNWRRFIVPKKVEQLNDYSFIDTYKPNKIKLAWIKWRWTIAKCVWDEKTKLGQSIGYRLWGSYDIKRSYTASALVKAVILFACVNVTESSIVDSLLTTTRQAWKKTKRSVWFGLCVFNCCPPTTRPTVLSASVAHGRVYSISSSCRIS